MTTKAVSIFERNRKKWKVMFFFMISNITKYYNLFLSIFFKKLNSRDITDDGLRRLH